MGAFDIKPHRGASATSVGNATSVRADLCSSSQALPLRNSASRLRYGEDVRELTESLRVEVRPLVKVAGERLGDMSAAAYAPAPLGREGAVLA